MFKHLWLVLSILFPPSLFTMSTRDFVTNNYYNDPVIVAEQGQTVVIVCKRNSCATFDPDWILRMEVNDFRPETLNVQREIDQLEDRYNLSLTLYETPVPGQQCLTEMHLNVTLGVCSRLRTGGSIHVFCGYSGLVINGTHNDTHHEDHNSNYAIIRESGVTTNSDAERVICVTATISTVTATHKMSSPTPTVPSTIQPSTLIVPPPTSSTNRQIIVNSLGGAVAVFVPIIIIFALGVSVLIYKMCRKKSSGTVFPTNAIAMVDEYPLIKVSDSAETIHLDTNDGDNLQ